MTRDYSLELTSAPAPLLSVFGGKITTYRALAEEAVDRLAPRFAHAGRAWTRTAKLPGGDMPGGDFEAFARELAARYPDLPDGLRQRLARAYGTRIVALLDGAGTLAELGTELAPGLHERELEYLWRTEWARSADDALWRRSKLGLRCGPVACARIERWFETRRSP